jgi:hypothetical protein
VGIKLVQTRWVLEAPTGTKILFYLRKPDTPVSEELTKLVLGAYNQAATGLVKMLEKDFNGQPTDGNASSTPGG